MVAATKKEETQMAKKNSTSARSAKSKAKTDPVASLVKENANLKTTLQQIERQFGEGSIMPLGLQNGGRIDGITTGSLSLDMALGGGGVPRARIAEVFGPESSGKTTLALHIVANAQKSRRNRSIHRRRTCAGSLLGQKTGSRIGNLARQPAESRRGGNAHRGAPDQVERSGCHRD